MFTFNQKTPNSSVVQPLHFAGENAEFRPVLPSERPRRTLEWWSSQARWEEKQIRSGALTCWPRLTSMVTVASWPPELGLSGLLTTGTLPRGQSCRGGGHTGPASLGPGPACVGEVAGSRIWVTGEGRPAFHPLRLLPPQKKSGVGL